MAKQRKRPADEPAKEAVTLNLSFSPPSPNGDGSKSKKEWLTFWGVVLAAFIAAVGTVVVVLVKPAESKSTVPTSPSVVPSAVASLPLVKPKFDVPVVQNAIVQSQFGFADAPEIRVKVEQPSGMAKKAVVAYISRLGILPPKSISPSYLSFESQADNRVVHAKLRTASAIQDSFNKGRFGRYSVFFEAWARDNSKSESHEAQFNYVYDDEFRRATFTANQNTSFHFLPAGGLLIEKQSDAGKYSSADSTETFHLGTSGFVLGQFQFWPTTKKDVIALEIGFLADGTDNSRFTVTLPDGPLDSFSITPYPERRESSSIRNAAFPMKPNGPDNFFAILWKRLPEDKIGCRLFVCDSLQELQQHLDVSVTGQKQPVVHERTFSLASLGVDYFRLRVQGRGNGKILLKRLVASELPYRI